MRRIIDPPVGPYSPPEHIEEWLDELRELKRTTPPDEHAEIDRAIREAEVWMEWRG